MNDVVNFLIVGAQKCGTTTLYKMLDRHPMISGCPNKEPGFWAASQDWRRGVDDYHKIFPDIESERLSFEASTIYTFYPMRNLGIWEDVFEYNPDMKIIYVVRNPVDRIISAYMHTFEIGWENDGIEDALRNNRLYLDVSRYYTQIAPWIERFGSDQVLLLDFDEIRKAQSSLAEKVFLFLGVDPLADTGGSIRANRTLEDRKVNSKFLNLTPLAQRFQEQSPKFVQDLVRPLWRRVAYNRSRVFAERPMLSPRSLDMVRRTLELEMVELGRLMSRDLSEWIPPR